MIILKDGVECGRYFRVIALETPFLIDGIFKIEHRIRVEMKTGRWFKRMVCIKEWVIEASDEEDMEWIQLYKNEAIDLFNQITDPYGIHN